MNNHDPYCLESLGGIVSPDGSTVTFYASRNKIRYDEILRDCLKEEFLNTLEPEKIYQSDKIGLHFIRRKAKQME